MRILWLSPSLRNRAQIGAQAIRDAGAEIMLVTADLTYECGPRRDFETILGGRPVPTDDWLPVLRTYRKAKQFRPDVVVTELLRDPRWRIMTRLAPRVRIIHDADPHDATPDAPWWNRLFFNRWDSTADATLVFSEYVARRLRTLVPASPAYVAPLHSDLEPSLVPRFVPAEQRRDFVLFGRQRPYKNHKVVFAAWEAHVAGDAWCGDELVLLGDGEIAEPLPPHTRWDKSAYKYSEVVDRLAHAKGSLIHYRSGASQSGVQVLSLQLGVPTLASDAGGLFEYQPPDLGVTGVDDVVGLSRSFDRLADPEELARQCRISAEHHSKHFEPKFFAERFLEIMAEVVGRSRNNVSRTTTGRLP
jgi:glycosyltransferase involved in cell wall biosynthesis